MFLLGLQDLRVEEYQCLVPYPRIYNLSLVCSILKPMLTELSAQEQAVVLEVGSFDIR